MLPLLLVTALAAPEPTSLSWHLVREVYGGQGAYLNYTDRLISDGHVEIGAVVGTIVPVHTAYVWHWSSSEGDVETGEEDRRVRVDANTRRYQDRVDLDEYDDDPPGELAVWLWVPTSLREGGQVALLDAVATVASISAPCPTQPERTCFELRTTGTDKTDDDYGQMTREWNETWWFDTGTGLYAGSRYGEQARGLIDGELGSFRVRETMELREADWRGIRDPAELAELARLGSSPDVGGVLAGLLVALAGFGSLFGLPWLIRRLRNGARRSIEVEGLGTVTFSALTDARALGPLTLERSALAPFVPDFVRRALAQGGRVWVARTGEGVVGLALTEPESPVGTVLANADAVAVQLCRHSGLKTWFTEHPHAPGPPEPMRVAERWRVLRLEAPTRRPWDGSLVRRMTDADRPAVAELLLKVGGQPARRWLDAHLDDGELGFVAEVGGALVGCAFAGLHDEVGRLHGLVVHPDHRGQGIGSELVRARVDALAVLGAASVLTEIATWNTASLHLAQEQGFAPLAELLLETIEAENPPGRVRR